MKRHNQTGFSLVEILVAMGLAAALSLVVVQIMKQSTKNSLTTGLKNEFNEVRVQIEGALKNKEMCRLSLRNLSLGDPVKLVNWNNTKSELKNLFYPGQALGKLKINSMSLEKDDFISTIDGGYTNIIVEVDLANDHRRDIATSHTKSFKIKTFVDNCSRSLIINQASKENLKLECGNTNGKLKNAVQGSLGWYGVCQHCQENRETIYDCELSEV